MRTGMPIQLKPPALH